ncbi:MAG: hypothetical protein AUH81_06205 [Candidatus Rokubacteria bacterium 13_1_40CM_4_69_5]|nr:MAG: hypothetical protein AUH81_06205 [Candidatus Rokubacteria bacterium 13_1_40CM_4_69_5]
MTKQADDTVTASLVTLGALTAAAAIVVAFVLGVARWQSPASVDDGVRSISDGHYSSAVRTLLAAVAQAPADARAHYYLGLAYAHLGVQTGAISQFQDAVRLVPREPKFHAGLGRAYREVGDRPAARGELEESCSTTVRGRPPSCGCDGPPGSAPGRRRFISCWPRCSTGPATVAPRCRSTTRPAASPARDRSERSRTRHYALRDHEKGAFNESKSVCSPVGSRRADRGARARHCRAEVWLQREPADAVVE